MGNLFFSVKLKKYNIPKLYILNYLIGIILYDTISFFLNDNNKLYLKWPNDLLIKNRKVAGILIDTETEGANIKNLYIDKLI